MRRFAVAALLALALALAPAAAAQTQARSQTQGDEGGGGTWWGMPCDPYYFGWVATVNGQTAICLNDGTVWMWWPL